MANPNFKGRQKGTIKKISTIIDPALGDYKIIFDEENEWGKTKKYLYWLMKCTSG